MLLPVSSVQQALSSSLSRLVLAKHRFFRASLPWSSTLCINRCPRLDRRAQQ